MEAKKDEPKVKKLGPVLAVRMSAEIASRIRGAFRVSIPLPDEGPAPVVGDRLFLREWIGAATGRADLVSVVEASAAGLQVERVWGWRSNKMDDDLSMLSLTVIPDRFPKIGFA